MGTGIRYTGEFKRDVVRRLVMGLRLPVCGLVLFALMGCQSVPKSSDGDIAEASSSAQPSTLNTPSNNKTCKPSFKQIYQPPLKLGGVGRVILVPKGEKCTLKKNVCDRLREYKGGVTKRKAFKSKWNRQRLSVATFLFPDKSFHTVDRKDLLKRAITEHSKYSKYDLSLITDDQNLYDNPVYADINIINYNRAGLKKNQFISHSEIRPPSISHFESFANFGIYNTIPYRSTKLGYLNHTSSYGIRTTASSPEVLTGRIVHSRSLGKIHHVFCNISTDVNEQLYETLLQECFLRAEGFPGVIEFDPDGGGEASHFHVQNYTPVDKPNYLRGFELIEKCQEE
ncbi:MAG: hypothetical protein COA43_15090 [Robiginitomaculum sp.]|nr:MAG: hypothetical protein COA43_15090 [Robiginitomaculum sp.]